MCLTKTFVHTSPSNKVSKWQSSQLANDTWRAIRRLTQADTHKVNLEVMNELPKILSSPEKMTKSLKKREGCLDSNVQNLL